MKREQAHTDAWLLWLRAKPKDESKDQAEGKGKGKGKVLHISPFLVEVDHRIAPVTNTQPIYSGSKYLSRHYGSMWG